jgi:acyl carrier protein
MSDPIDGLQCRLVLSDDDFVLRNHSVHGVSVLPGVTYLDVVIRLLHAAGIDRTDVVIENVIFAEAITTSAESDRELRCTVRASGADRYEVAIDSRWLRGGQPAGDWIANFTGEIAFRAGPEPPPLDLDDLKRRAESRSDLAELYQRACRENIVHGPAMRCTGDIWRGAADDPYLLAQLRLECSMPDIDQEFVLHPALLDASTLAGFAQTEVSGDHPFIPMFVRSFRALRSLPDPVYVHCPRPERLAQSGDVITSDYGLYDGQGRFLAGFTELTCKLIRHPGLITRALPDAGQGQPAASAAVAEMPPEMAGTAEPARPGPGGLLAALRETVADALHRDCGEVSLDVGFYDLGMDSLGVLNLGRRLEELVGEPLYPTLLFEYSTIERLAGYLERTYPAAVAAADSAEPPHHAGRPPAAPASGTRIPEPEPELTLSLRADTWIAEEGPVRPPSALAVVGNAAAQWAAGQPAGDTVRILPPEQAAAHEDILVVHDAGAEPVAACAALTRLAAAAVDRPPGLRASRSPVLASPARCCRPRSPRCAGPSPRKRRCLPAGSRPAPPIRRPGSPPRWLTPRQRASCISMAARAVADGSSAGGGRFLRAALTARSVELVST